ncbi:hypothetical protein [Rossellomorea marisflavi]|uniref:hypothetical protein n=1 Tax=Rossellomorea marisflavi TaxID=189381 RepID=UPI003513AB39
MGPQGPAGPQGTQGSDGPQGPQGCGGKSAYGQTKIFFLGFFAATALLALAILGLLTDMDRFQRVLVG